MRPSLDLRRAGDYITARHQNVRHRLLNLLTDVNFRNEKSGSESPGKRRKSVAFTEDTKTEDGNSAQTLFQNWFAAESGAAEQAESEAPAVVETANATSDSPKPTKEKKAKKSKPEKSQLSEGSKDKQAKVRKEKSTDKPTPIYVQYLQQYHTDKASWKFNKSKQNDLIKNLWNVYRIIPEHDEALGEYISGLQGEAARQRIKEASEATLKKELEKLLGECKKAATKLSEEFQTPEMEDPAKRLAAAESSLKKYLETLHTTGALSDSAFDEEVENARTAKARGDRAELILRVAFGLDTAEALRPVPLTARAKKRSKKSRTAADSSDDSSSDSDDDEGSSAKKPKTAPKSILKKPAKEDESSSSENDSSSDSSSDDSSDEDSDSSDSDSSSESESDSDDGSSSESDKDSSKKKAKKETKKEAKKEQAPARSEREWTPPKKAVPFDKALLDQIYNSKKQMLYRR